MAEQYPITYIYKYTAIDFGKFKSVTHYELEKFTGSLFILSPRINISKDRNFANSSPDSWLKLRFDENWVKPAATGLFKTKAGDFIFCGDLENKKHLILFEFSKDLKEVKLFLFPDYFPFDVRLHPATIGKKITKQMYLQLCNKKGGK